MNEKKKIYRWMKGIADIKPANFAEHFYSDIFDYVFPQNYDDIAPCRAEASSEGGNLADENMLSGKMKNKLLKCSSENEVKHWMDDVAGNIIMNIDTEQIISEYLT